MVKWLIMHPFGTKKGAYCTPYEWNKHEGLLESECCSSP